MVKKVKVYSTKNCPWCVKVKEFLKKNKIKFEEVDVSNDSGAAQEMIEKSGQLGVPVIEIGEKIIVGFEEEAIKKELNLK